MAFEVEKSTFEKHRAEWLRKGLAGRFAVIKGTVVGGNSYNSFELAFAAGVSAFQSEFLVQQISDTDEVQIINRCSWPVRA